MSPFYPRSFQEFEVAGNLNFNFWWVSLISFESCITRIYTPWLLSDVEMGHSMICAQWLCTPEELASAP
jgi:hypothetical protein